MYCNRVLDFYPVNSFVDRTAKVRNGKYSFSSFELKLFFVSGTLSEKVTNTLGMAKALGLNLTTWVRSLVRVRPVFFFKPEIFHFKNNCWLLFTCLCFIGCVLILRRLITELNDRVPVF